MRSASSGPLPGKYLKMSLKSKLDDFIRDFNHKHYSLPMILYYYDRRLEVLYDEFYALDIVFKRYLYE